MDQNAQAPAAVHATQRRQSRRPTLASGVLLLTVAGLCASLPGEAAADLPAELVGHVQELALSGARAGAPQGARVSVQLGALDSRLRLAPCREVQPYLPQGQRMWGKTRIGLRCLDGARTGPSGARWNVTLPVQVMVHARAVVAAQALPAGTTLSAALLQTAEVDIAAEMGQVFLDTGLLEGRSLQRPLVPGEAVRSSDLKARRWFAVGERVQVLASGRGYAVSGEAQALEPGFDGQNVRVRFENGRTVTGRAVGERRVEVLL
ncbi:flagellar basal body P-ring formation chaperone FlgA [Kinneretia asaccharophila]|jgi:flagella basal body P-ring formation protein FlgA|uniref:Flagella basal body P-ring formation protein FlgA n=1 Tax=Roseateles asaccharophilus TaxID=582607 RepID=A0A4R6MSQ9_9BURK|nr:flagellar basal body P-ring formation chaperone FlgA [Roseateles asaccharophilus]MDN3546556.1 flagellar basal body P-ring formation chaperone FlgA [Roseateles asaccharophilus]TDP05022.1 flagella basal body P-ring formation protein FlgA [Roseateles asaccharophilus]